MASYAQDYYWVPGYAVGDTGAYSLSAAAGAVALSGQDAGLNTGKVVGATAGSYALAGLDAPLVKSSIYYVTPGYWAVGYAAGENTVVSYTLSSDPGAYTFSEQTGALVTTFILSSASGSYTLAGQAANLTTAFPPKTITADAGSFALAGQTAGLVYTSSSSVASGNAFGDFPIDGGWLNGEYNRWITGDTATIALTGQAATVGRGFTLGSTNGAYSLAGQTSGTLVGHKLASDAAGLILNGEEALLTVVMVTARLVPGETGALAITGQDAALIYPRTLFAADGRPQLIGASAILKTVKSIASDAGAITADPIDANLIKGAAFSLSISQGTYTLTGQSATIIPGRSINATDAQVAVTGQDAAIKRTIIFAASEGSIALTVPDANLNAIYGSVIVSSPAAYTLAGQSVSLAMQRVVSAGTGDFQVGRSDALLTKGSPFALEACSIVLTGGAAQFAQSLFVPTLERQFRVESEKRTFSVAASYQRLPIASDNRTLKVNSEDRRVN